MSLALLKASLAAWHRRLTYRHKRHVYYHAQSKRPAAERKQLAEKWHKLEAQAQAMIAKREQQIRARRPKPSARGRAVAWASSKVGIVEQPSGSNGNPANISKWQAAFGFGRVPWCGCFAGMALREAGVHGVTSRIAAVSLIEDDAKAHRAPFKGWSSGAGVMRGDLVVIGGRGIHVELVVELHGDGSCSTVGGNTSFGPGGSQSNGGCVARRRRSPGEIYGYALVNHPNQ